MDTERGAGSVLQGDGGKERDFLLSRQHMGGVSNHGDDLLHIERLGEEEDVQAKEQVIEGERKAAHVSGHEEVAVPGRQLLVRRHHP